MRDGAVCETAREEKFAVNSATTATNARRENTRRQTCEFIRISSLGGEVFGFPRNCANPAISDRGPFFWETATIKKRLELAEASVYASREGMSTVI
jgi:hypothetical protein